MKAVVTLSPEESKRLIAKAIAQSDVVKREKKKGEPSLQDPPSPCDDCFLLKNPDLGVRCSTMRHLE